MDEGAEPNEVQIRDLQSFMETEQQKELARP